LVLGFAAALDTATAAVCGAVTGLERFADILALARSRRIGRRGTAGGYAYTVHGAGCRLTGTDGACVDVDFSEGTAVFDPWRVRRYGLSLAEPVDLTEAQIHSAMGELHCFLAELRPGWFSLAGTPDRCEPTVR
jgi:hypothetical protein